MLKFYLQHILGGKEYPDPAPYTSDDAQKATLEVTFYSKLNFKTQDLAKEGLIEIHNLGRKCDRKLLILDMRMRST
jgi:hypothetical protein